MEKTRDELKQQASDLDLVFPDNIPTDKLISMIREKEEEDNEPNETREEMEARIREEIRAEEHEKFKKRLEENIEKVENTTTLNRQNRSITPKMMKDMNNRARRLVLANIISRDPVKVSWEGEIITVSNDVIGDVKKYIKYNTTEGFFVPQIILDALKGKKCTVYKTYKKKGQTFKKPILINAYSIDILPTPTEEDLKEMAKAQKQAQLDMDME